MPGGAGGYLPPVVCQLLADAGPGIRVVEEFKVVLADFASKDYTARIGVEIDPASLAKLAALGAAAGGGGGGGLLAGTAAGAAAGGGGGGKGSLGGLLAGLLWGKGMRLGWGRLGIGGLAGLGTLGSFAGFGAEHALLTLLGLGGSAAGGALGGGLLGLGGLGTMGVGMGSDLIIAKSTLGDTKQISNAMTALAKATAVFGANSRQAKVAAAQLQYTINSLGGAAQVGVAAEIKLATAMQAFGAVFDKTSQAARAAFVNNLALPAVAMAQTYLPLIADAATRNFGIMGNAIKPLFAFLAGPGHKIFADLENVFARDLPIGTGIFVQSLELVLKTIDHIATTANFGSFLQKILDFVTKLNTTGFGALMKQVDKMIALFHIWATFVAVLGRDIVDMFSQATGLGSGIIQSLTQMLQQLGEWERSTQGKAAMHNLFQVHREEILALLKLIPPLVVAVGRIYLAIAPVMVRVVTALATVIVKVVDFLTSLGGGVGVVASWAIGIGLLMAKLHLLGPAFSIVKGAFLALRAIGIAGMFSPIGIAIMAIIVIGFLLITHWKQVQAIARTVWGWIGPFVKTALTAVGNFIKEFVAGAKVWWNAHKDEIMQVWSAIKTIISVAVSFVVGWIKLQFAIIGPIIKTAFDLAIGVLRTAWDIIKTVFTVALDLITGHWNRAWTDLKNGVGEIFRSIVTTATQFGKDIVSGIAGGIGAMAHLVQNAIHALLRKLPGWAQTLLGISSPSKVMAQLVGIPIVQGIVQGITDSQGLALAAMARLTQQLTSAARVRSGYSSGFGGLALAGAGGGSITVHSQPTINIHGATGNPQQIGSAVQKALDKHTADLVKMLKGGVYLPGQGLP